MLAYYVGIVYDLIRHIVLISRHCKIRWIVDAFSSIMILTLVANIVRSKYFTD